MKSKQIIKGLSNREQIRFEQGRSYGNIEQMKNEIGFLERLLEKWNKVYPKNYIKLRKKELMEMMKWNLKN